MLEYLSPIALNTNTLLTKFHHLFNDNKVRTANITNHIATGATVMLAKKETKLSITDHAGVDVFVNDPPHTLESILILGIESVYSPRDPTNGGNLFNDVFATHFVRGRIFINFTNRRKS